VHSHRAAFPFPPGDRRPIPAGARLGALAVLALLVSGILNLAGPAAPASAHGREVLVKVTAPTPEPGSPAKVTAVATFLDGDKAAGVALTAVATGPGKRATVRLKASGRPGTYTGSLRLAPGRWKLTVTAGGDHAGRGSATLTVPAPPTTAAPTTTITATTSAPAATSAPATSLDAQPAAASAPPGGNGLTVAAVVIAVAVLAGGLALLVTRQRRRHPGTRA
jgi:hypothetical protein